MAGLYAHIPFRRGRRPYDDHDGLVTPPSDFSRFEAALSRELRYYARRFTADEPMTTVYAGGGRPSLLPPSSIHAVLTTLVDVFDTSSFEEATAEVNPADATARYVHDLNRMGFDRLSLSVLSFSPEVLDALDAPHSAVDTDRALRRTRKAGFRTYSVDLLFGVENQSLSTWEATLRHAVDRGVPHVTLVEVPQTGASEEARADQLELAMTVLEGEDYEQYELTHFARPGHRSAHQQNYYAHGNYLGIGPSAESFWWAHRPQSPRARRWSNVTDVDRYATLLRQRYPPVSYRQTLDRRALAQEFILLRLRTNDGLDLSQLAMQYDVDLRSEKAGVLDRLRDDALIQDTPDRVRLTRRGRLLTDAITKRLLPD